MPVPWMLLAGMVDCLIQLHKWPHGLDGNLEKWLPQATQVITGIMDKHARVARNQGISPQEHVRKLLDFPGCVHALPRVLASVHCTVSLC